jgi:hypothetical protein
MEAGVVTAQPSRVAAMLGQPVDLLAIDTSQPRPWTPGASRITRPGLRSIWFGSRGTGKSLAALILAVQVIEAGGSASYVDFENGPLRQAERLAAILAERPAKTRAAVRERLDYRPNARLGKLSEAAVDEWATLFEGRELAIIDSTARALGQLGLDENSTPDFGTFMVGYIDPPAQRGTAMILLDNTGWSESERSRGASGKWDMVELVYKVTGTDFAPDKAGSIALERARTRDGDEARRLIAYVGDGTYSEIHRPEQSERQAAVVEAILAHVEAHPGSSTEEVAKGVGIRKAECRSQLADLESLGTGVGTVVRRPSRHPDRRGRVHTRQGWFLASQSQLAAVPDSRTDADPGSTAANGGPGLPSLKDGTGVPTADLDGVGVVAAGANGAGADPPSAGASSRASSARKTRKAAR